MSTSDMKHLTSDIKSNRWMVPDPMGQYHNPYLGMGNNPVNRVDPTGGVDVTSVMFNWAINLLKQQRGMLFKTNLAFENLENGSLIDFLLGCVMPSVIGPGSGTFGSGGGSGEIGAGVGVMLYSGQEQEVSPVCSEETDECGKTDECGDGNGDPPKTNNNTNSINSTIPNDVNIIAFLFGVNNTLIGISGDGLGELGFLSKFTTAGYVATTLTIGYNYFRLSSDPNTTKGQWVQFGVQSAAGIATCIPNAYSAGAGLLITMIDAAGGLDWYYNNITNLDQLGLPWTWGLAPGITVYVWVPKKP